MANASWFTSSSDNSGLRGDSPFTASAFPFPSDAGHLATSVNSLWNGGESGAANAPQPSLFSPLFSANSSPSPDNTATGLSSFSLFKEPIAQHAAPVANTTELRGANCGSLGLSGALSLPNHTEESQASTPVAAKAATSQQDPSLPSSSKARGTFAVPLPTTRKPNQESPTISGSSCTSTNTTSTPHEQATPVSPPRKRFQSLGQPVTPLMQNFSSSSASCRFQIRCPPAASRMPLPSSLPSSPCSPAAMDEASAKSTVPAALPPLSKPSLPPASDHQDMVTEQPTEVSPRNNSAAASTEPRVQTSELNNQREKEVAALVEINHEIAASQQRTQEFCTKCDELNEAIDTAEEELLEMNFRAHLALNQLLMLQSPSARNVLERARKYLAGCKDIDPL